MLKTLNKNYRYQFPYQVALGVIWHFILEKDNIGVEA